MPSTPRFRDGLRVAVFIATCAAAWASFAQENGVPRRFREAVTLDTDSAVTKQFGTVQEYFRSKQWTQGIDILAGLSETHGDSLLGVAPGRYVNVALSCQLVLAGMPPEALAIYRAKVDPQARRWLDAGRAGDAASLERIVRRAFASSVGDDALALLAEQAWDRGDVATARRLWEQLVPLDAPATAGTPLPVLRYPDPALPASEAVARMVLCSIIEGNLDRADREIAVFAARHAAAEGFLAGERGNLLKILERVRSEAKAWKAAPTNVSVSTFAVTPERSGLLRDAAEVGGPQWEAKLAPLRIPAARGPTSADPPPSVHPVVHGDLVFASDGLRISAWKILGSSFQEGRPEAAWPNGIDDSAVIHQTADADGPPPIPDTSLGVPRYTMTVQDGRLYARLGSPVTGRSRHELRALDSELVCLDVSEEKQGRLLWSLIASEALEERGWSFEGAPVVAGDRFYIVLRKSQPQMQLNVACFQADGSRLLWNRKVCTAVSPLGERDNLVSSLLLTRGDDALFLSTDLGAVAAIDARDGTLRWVSTYEPRSIDEAKLNDDREIGLLPCLFAQGTVVAAPNDAPGLMAFDARSGALLWEQAFGDRVHDLLGTTDGGLLIVGGRKLRGIELRTGRVVWPRGETVPEGFGRGILAGEFIYWPTRDDLFVVSQQTGQILQRKPRPGGNLVIAEGHLMVARPDRLVAYCDHATLKSRATRDLSAKPNDPLPRFRLARACEGLGELENALGHYTDALRMLGPAEIGEPALVRRAALARLFALHDRLGQAAAVRRDVAAANRHWEAALAIAPDATARASLARQIAEASASVDPAAAIAAWKKLLASRELAALSLPVASSDAGITSVPVRRLALDSLGRIRRAHGEAPFVAGGLSPDALFPSPVADEEPEVATAESTKGPWRRAWERTLEPNVVSIVPKGHPDRGHPGVVIESSDEAVCRLADTGRIAWRRPSRSPIVWATLADKALVLGELDGLTGVALGSGELRWNLRFPVAANTQSSHAAPAGDQRFRAIGQRILHFDGGRIVRCVDGRSGMVEWEHELPIQRAPPAWGLIDGVACFQLNEPPRIVRLKVRDGAADIVRLTPAATWLSPPVALDGARLSLVTENRRVQGIARGGTAWTWTGGMSWANADPALLSRGNVLLMVVDGDTLVRLAPDSGARLWSRPLARTPIRRADEALSIDDDRVYVQCDGILRAFALRDGRTMWEQPVGVDGATWKTSRVGELVVAWPAVATAGEPATLVCAEAATGDLVQRMTIAPPDAPGPHAVSVEVAGESLVLRVGPKLVVFGPLQ